MNYLINQAKKLKQRLNKISQVATPIEVEKNEQILYIRYLQEGMTVFDVGANIGELSLLFSRFVGSSGQVHAFEASQSTFDKLSTVCKIANYPQITLNHLDVADQEKILKLRGTWVLRLGHDGQWRIMHEHVSAPLENPYGTGDWK
jgi:tRNA A58 N-methylase Trm61